MKRFDAGPPAHDNKVQDAGSVSERDSDRRGLTGKMPPSRSGPLPRKLGPGFEEA